MCLNTSDMFKTTLEWDYLVCARIQVAVLNETFCFISALLLHPLSLSIQSFRCRPQPHSLNNMHSALDWSAAHTCVRCLGAAGNTLACRWLHCKAQIPQTIRQTTAVTRTSEIHFKLRHVRTMLTRIVTWCCSPNTSFSGATGMQRPSSSSAMQNGYAEPHQMQDSIWSGAMAAASGSFSNQSRAKPPPHPTPPPMRPAEPTQQKPDLDVSRSKPLGSPLPLP